MRRLQLIEVEDQPWCPAPIRDAMTDYLQFVLNVAKPYRAVVPQLRQAVREAGAREIVDLCSGGGGPWAGLLPELDSGLEAPVRVRLTDRYPNLAARRILLDAVERRQGIGIFEFTERRAAPILGMLLVLLTTPAIRPFRWSRLLWTYLIGVPRPSARAAPQD